jgi:AcrR family transcriptional regulator
MSPRRARAVSGHQEPDPARALRRHLIDVTQRLLGSHGLGTLTTRQIADAAEVSHGVLYNHFADKDELILAALHEQFSNLIAQFKKSTPVPGSANIEANLFALAHACMSFHAGAFPLAGTLFGRVELLNQFLDHIHAGDAGPQTVVMGVADYLRAEQQLGRANVDVEPVAFATMLFGACQARLLASHLGQLPSADLDSDVGSMVDILVRSLRSP